jgi:phenylalanyl-tRNA synthetase beta chain
MVNIDISIEDISRLMGLEETLTPEELDKIIAFTKSEVDSEPDGPDENGHTKISIDVKTASRPDLWSAEGIAREARGRINLSGLPKLDFPSSDYEIEVEKDVLKIRPYIGAFIAKGLTLDNFLIKQLIQAQDKVDFSFGRKRKRTSIGIYNLDMISKKILYKTVERDFSFVPLQFTEKMTIDEIMQNHPKGQEYGHILENHKKVPILVDDNGQILSLPPIINSNDVGRVTEDTKNVLVEVTGTNFQALSVVTALFAQILHDRGTEVSTVKIHYPKGFEIEEDVTPMVKPLEILVPVKEINRYLGTKITKNQMVKLLQQRRHEASVKGQKIHVRYGPWRSDILHWVDIAEEIAIAYDYNKMDPTIAKIFTPGKLPQSTESENMIREILVGMGLQEVLNYNLTDKETISVNVARDEAFIEKEVITVSNPVTRTYGYLRPDLLPGLIRFVSRNSETQFPHRIFETGESVKQIHNDTLTYVSASVILAGPNETFETAHQILDVLFRLTNVQYSLEESQNPYFINGRCAEIHAGDLIVGYIGEIDFEILEKNDIKMPVSAFEIDLTKIPKYNIKPMYSNRNL